VIDFVRGLQGQDVVGVFGNCCNPNNSMLGYQFTRGVVQDVSPAQQLIFQKNHGSLSLRSLCDMIPVVNLRDRNGGRGRSYVFETQPIGKAGLLMVNINSIDPALAYASATRFDDPAVHILTSVRSTQFVREVYVTLS